MKPIKLIELYSNGSVAVFDEDNNQIIELQGPYYRVRGAIFPLLTDKTVVFAGSLGSMVPMGLQQFTEMPWHFGLEREQFIVLVEGLAQELIPWENEERTIISQQQLTDGDKADMYTRVCVYMGMQFNTPEDPSITKEQALEMVAGYEAYAYGRHPLVGITARWEGGSKAKAMRWLGFCQGLVVAWEVFTLDDVKHHSMNRRVPTPTENSIDKIAPEVREQLVNNLADAEESLKRLNTDPLATGGNFFTIGRSIDEIKKQLGIA